MPAPRIRERDVGHVTGRASWAPELRPHRRCPHPAGRHSPSSENEGAGAEVQAQRPRVKTKPRVCDFSAWRLSTSPCGLILFSPNLNFGPVGRHFNASSPTLPANLCSQATHTPKAKRRPLLSRPPSSAFLTGLAYSLPPLRLLRLAQAPPSSLWAHWPPNQGGVSAPPNRWGAPGWLSVPSPSPQPIAAAWAWGSLWQNSSVFPQAGELPAAL